MYIKISLSSFSTYQKYLTKKPKYRENHCHLYLLVGNISEKITVLYAYFVTTALRNYLSANWSVIILKSQSQIWHENIIPSIFFFFSVISNKVWCKFWQKIMYKKSCPSIENNRVYSALFFDAFLFEKTFHKSALVKRCDSLTRWHENKCDR